ncbi:MAG TPA: septum formation initiator family protein, partial [Chitinophagaceae bacterium]|nr:septum formation initiator family protein [Chitinophagaceae bacterium]
MTRFLQHIPPFLRNKYFLSFSIFLVIIVFLDKNDLFTQLDRRHQLKELKHSKDYYSTQITAERKELEALKNNPAILEKYAREKYLMKRADEELFLVP